MITPPKAHRCQFFPERSLGRRGNSGPWTLWKCRICNWVKLGESPSLTEAYPKEYYGSGSRKFVYGIEWASTLLPPRLKDCIKKIVNTAKPEERAPRILDIGCGRGYLLHRLVQTGWQCAGLDIPQSPIPVRFSAVDFRVGSADEVLPWPTALFDLVVLNHVLEHTANPRFVVSEALRVIRPGGYVYVGVPNFESWQALCFKDFWFPLEIPRHLHHFGPLALRLLLEDCGFKIKHFSTRSLRQGIFGYIQSFLNIFDQKNPDLLFEFLKGQTDSSIFRMTLHIFFGCLTIPLAIIESFLSPFFNRGPVIIMVAQKEVAS